MKIILTSLLALIGLGFYEGFVKPLAIKIFYWKVFLAAPAVLRLLDPILAKALTQYSGKELDQLVRSLFEEVTGTEWSQADLTIFYKLYDIRKAADVTP